MVADARLLDVMIEAGMFAPCIRGYNHHGPVDAEIEELECKMRDNSRRYAAAIEPIARGVAALVRASSGKLFFKDITHRRRPSLEVLDPGRAWTSLLVRTDNAVGECGGFDLSAVILGAYSVTGYITLVFRTSESGGRALVSLFCNGSQSVETYNPVFDPSDTLEIVLGVKDFNVGGRNYVRIPEVFLDPRGEDAFVEWVEGLPTLLRSRTAQLLG